MAALIAVVAICLLAAGIIGVMAVAIRRQERNLALPNQAPDRRRHHHGPAGESGTSAQVRRPRVPDAAGSPNPARADEYHNLASRGADAGGTPPWDSMSAGTGMGSSPGWLLFRRIVDIPFEACVAALESWQREGCASGLLAGRLRGPVEHDRGSGTYRVAVRLARGPLRPPLRMRLHVDCWSSSSRTALELIPCRRVRATPSYFRAGHLLLDSMTHSLQPQRQTQALDLPSGTRPELTPSDPARTPRVLPTGPSRMRCPVGPVHRNPGPPPPLERKLADCRETLAAPPAARAQRV